MKALQIMGVEDARVVEVDLPEPGENQVLVRVSEVNTCPHWDLHIYYGKPMFADAGPVSFPYALGQPGHEMVGVVASVGPGVTAFKAGDRVASWRDQGHMRQGCYAQYGIQADANLLPVPDGISDRQVASLELAMCVASTILDLKAANALADKVVGISGLGSAGLVAAQMAKAEGASEVVGFDLNSGRMKQALSYGVDRAIDPRSDKGRDFPERTKPGALDVSIDCVGGWSSIKYLMDHTNEITAIFGVQRENYLYWHGTLKLFGYPGHFYRSAEYAMDLIAKGLLDLTPLATHRLPLEAYDQAVQLLKNQQAMKVCFLPWE